MFGCKIDLSINYEKIFGVPPMWFKNEFMGEERNASLINFLCDRTWIPLMWEYMMAVHEVSLGHRPVFKGLIDNVVMTP